MRIATLFLCLMMPLSAMAVKFTVVTDPTVETKDPIIKQYFQGVEVPSSIRDLAIKENQGMLGEQEKERLEEARQYVEMKLLTKPVCQVRKNKAADRKSSVRIGDELPACTAQQKKSPVYHHPIGISTSFGDSDSSEIYYKVNQNTLSATKVKLRAMEAKWRQEGIK